MVLPDYAFDDSNQQTPLTALQALYDCHFSLQLPLQYQKNLCMNVHFIVGTFEGGYFRIPDVSSVFLKINYFTM